MLRITLSIKDADNNKIQRNNRGVMQRAVLAIHSEIRLFFNVLTERVSNRRLSFFSSLVFFEFLKRSFKSLMKVPLLLGTFENIL